MVAGAAFFGRRPVVDDVRRPGVWPLLLFMGIVDAGVLVIVFSRVETEPAP